MSVRPRPIGASFVTASQIAFALVGCVRSLAPALIESRPLKQVAVPPGSDGRKPASRTNVAESNEGSYSEGALDDDQDDDSEPVEPQVAVPEKVHPLAPYTDDELGELFAKHPAFVGSVSVGKPNSGRLINGIRPTESPLYRLVDPVHAWGTTETVEDLVHVLEVVARAHPGTQSVDIGHISAASGGPLRPHHSHQSGRDVDLGLYYAQPGTPWYTQATQQTLDVPRTWTLIRTLATDTDIEMILLDRRLQEHIEKYASSVERDANWVHRLFHGDEKKFALVRHSPGHATHLHLRFRNPMARETARRLSSSLPIEHRQEAPGTSTATVHVASSGDTLAKLAERYHTTMDTIRKANHMHTFQLVAGQRYVIPVETVPSRTSSSEPRQRNTAHKR